VAWRRASTGLYLGASG